MCPGGSPCLKSKPPLYQRPRACPPHTRKRTRRFQDRSHRILNGECDETQFIGFRLKQGVYGQRQPDVQMMRVKLPFGGVTPEQMEAFAEIAEQLRAPPQRPHHYPPELPVPPHSAGRGRGSAHACWARRACPPRGVRQHRPQRDRRPWAGVNAERAVRPDAVGWGVRALLAAQPALPALAA